MNRDKLNGSLIAIIMRLFGSAVLPIAFFVNFTETFKNAALAETASHSTLHLSKSPFVMFSMASTWQAMMEKGNTKNTGETKNTILEKLTCNTAVYATGFINAFLK